MAVGGEEAEEKTDLSGAETLQPLKRELTDKLMKELYGSDLEWIADGRLVGMEQRESGDVPDFTMSNQRGYHWPPPDAVRAE